LELKVKITLLTDNPDSWIIPFIEQFKLFLKDKGCQVFHVFESSKVTSSDILFILACEKLVPTSVLEMNLNNIVVHPSDLPKHRGWSPLTWQILEGKNKIIISLFEAQEELDSGPIYLQETINFDGSELNKEIKKRQGEATLNLLKRYLENRDFLIPKEQEGEPSFCSKINIENSEININLSIKEQFNRLRVVDNERYPAFFHHKGNKYILKIYKEDEKPI
jgi:methionyl-tRNA formyltransferase